MPNNLFPQWSHDGGQIVFTSDRTGNDQLYAMQWDGSDVQRLTHSAWNERSAFWSPDGQRIAFSSQDEE